MKGGETNMIPPYHIATDGVDLDKHSAQKEYNMIDSHSQWHRRGGGGGGGGACGFMCTKAVSIPVHPLLI